MLINILQKINLKYKNIEKFFDNTRIYKSLSNEYKEFLQNYISSRHEFKSNIKVWCNCSKEKNNKRNLRVILTMNNSQSSSSQNNVNLMMTRWYLLDMSYPLMESVACNSGKLFRKINVNLTMFLRIEKFLYRWK